MGQTLRYLSIIGFIVSYVACSPVKFSANSSPDEGFTHSCYQTTSGCSFDYLVDITAPKVDILFVADNSASMSFEQKALATRFAGFISNLDTNSIDYRIALTTTDINEPGSNNEARAINGHGALQDGKLISFGASMPYLTPSIADRVARFNSTIVRPETLSCEQFIASYIAANGISSINTADYQSKYKINCPSGDERGVYAANLAVTNNPSSFMRSDAYLAIIFLADEDVRSGLYCNGPNNSTCQQTGFPLTDKDQPASLFTALQSKGKDSVTEVHSITVKDSTCLAEQNSQTLGTPAVPATAGLVQGSMGSVYQTFATAGWGESISICLNSYTAGLDPIVNKISQDKGAVLACSNPINLQVIPVPAVVGFTYTRTGKNVTFTGTPVPVGGQVRLVYSCSNNM